MADSGSPFRNSVLLNVGARDGVVDGWAVMDGLGLAGRISGVGNRTARVVLLTDSASRVPVVVQPSGQRAMLSGDNSAFPLLDFVEDPDDLRPGDRVVSSDDGGVFPAGLLVGEVVMTRDRRLRVRLAADYGRLEFLRVLRSRPMEQITSTGELILPPKAPGAEEARRTPRHQDGRRKTRPFPVCRRPKHRAAARAGSRCGPDRWLSAACPGGLVSPRCFLGSAHWSGCFACCRCKGWAMPAAPGETGLDLATWPAPDLMLALTLAWVVRRPDLLPAPLIAAYFFVEDILMMRPPGLWALIVLGATEFLRRATRRCAACVLAGICADCGADAGHVPAQPHGARNCDGAAGAARLEPCAVCRHSRDISAGGGGTAFRAGPAQTRHRRSR